VRQGVRVCLPVLPVPKVLVDPLVLEVPTVLVAVVAAAVVVVVDFVLLHYHRQAVRRSG